SQRLTRRGELHAASLPGEELHPEVPFQLLDVQRDGGLRAAERSRRGQKRSRLEDRGEGFEMSKLHGRTIDYVETSPTTRACRPGRRAGVAGGRRSATPRRGRPTAEVGRAPPRALPRRPGRGLPRSSPSRPPGPAREGAPPRTRAWAARDRP